MSLNQYVTQCMLSISGCVDNVVTINPRCPRFLDSVFMLMRNNLKDNINRPSTLLRH